MDENNNTLAETTSTTAVETETIQDETTNPVKTELENIQKKGTGRTELEKAIYTRAQIDKKIKELGGEQATVEIEDDNKPLTVADFKRMRQEEAQTSAIHLADSIQDADERELVKHHLNNTIKPSGDAQTDLRNATALVNAVKNTQIAEIISQGSNTRSSSSVSSAGQPAKHVTKIVLTADEAMFKKAYKLTDEEIIASRKKSEQR